MISNLDPTAAREGAAAREGITLARLADQARKFAAARRLYTERLADFHAEYQDLLRRRLPGLSRAAAECADQRQQLAGLIQRAPELFTEPRTQEAHGVKYGLRKGKGSVTWDDDARVLALIRKRFTPEQIAAHGLIITTARPSREAITTELTVDQARQIGCTIAAAGDEVVIKAAASPVEKLLATLLTL